MDMYRIRENGWYQGRLPFMWHGHTGIFSHGAEMLGTGCALS